MGAGVDKDIKMPKTPSKSQTPDPSRLLRITAVHDDGFAASRGSAPKAPGQGK